MKKIKIKGLDKRGKTRVANYSDDGVFFLRRDLRLDGEDKILVESLTDNFRMGDRLTPWVGWLDIGTEIEILEEVANEEADA